LATNVVGGENDSGKTAIIDAIRLCLLTTAADFYRITRDDFHVGSNGCAGTFKITCGFKDLMTQEQAVFLELLTTDDDGNVALSATVKAELMDPLRPHRVGQGPALDGAARELLKATYLRTLRDAEAEPRSGRGSQLSQILAGYPAMRAQGEDDFDEGDPLKGAALGCYGRACRLPQYCRAGELRPGSATGTLVGHGASAAIWSPQHLHPLPSGRNSSS